MGTVLRAAVSLWMLTWDAGSHSAVIVTAVLCAAGAQPAGFRHGRGTNLLTASPALCGRSPKDPSPPVCPYPTAPAKSVTSVVRPGRDVLVPRAAQRAVRA
ncbi:MAG TPA: hypothetical protein VN520_21625 [Streptomyces sp.]|uniref:hypothetical protein n=1 Tax=Streptomyces sp. TaxID=1931 RepID=UPI002C41B540|nr:hypothetical protein [Streptomyces sp.]HWU08947.1 hypothetical protein [Streptomyces sp.]